MMNMFWCIWNFVKASVDTYLSKAKFITFISRARTADVNQLDDELDLIVTLRCTDGLIYHWNSFLSLSLSRVFTSKKRRHGPCSSIDSSNIKAGKISASNLFGAQSIKIAWIKQKISDKWKVKDFLIVCNGREERKLINAITRNS